MKLNPKYVTERKCISFSRSYKLTFILVYYRSAASPSMLRKFSSPIVANEGTPTTANKNYVKHISKRISKVTTQLQSTGISRRSTGEHILFAVKNPTPVVKNKCTTNIQTIYEN